jgi:hypothetical protein
MGWEYFNSLPGGEEKPWEWAQAMSALLRGRRTVPVIDGVERDMKARDGKGDGPEEVDPDEGGEEGTVPVPGEFDYHSEGGGEDE